MSNSFEDFGVPRKTLLQCEQVAEALRRAAGVHPKQRLPSITEVLELARGNIPGASELELIVLTDEQLPGGAYAKPDQREIYVNQTTYVAALSDEPEARFTLLHELAHVLLHRGQDRFFRISDGNVVYPFMHDEDTRAEVQADRIARALLMPRTLAEAYADPLQLARATRTPLTQAIARLKELAPRTANTAPPEVCDTLKLLKQLAPKAGLQTEREKAESLRLRLWHNLPIVAGEDPEKVRQCGQYQIFWSEFGKTTQCGWFIENEKIVSFFATRD